jgi:hypothetical protein
VDAIAIPGLTPVTDLTVHVAPPVDVGETPHGVRRVVPLLGGSFRGPRLNGTMIPGGSDYQYWRSDGVTEIHARYILETDTGARIYVENTGLRRGPPEAMDRLARGLPVEPAQIYFRSVARLETSAAELAWVNRSIFVCSGARFPDRVEIRIFEVG